MAINSTFSTSTVRSPGYWPACLVLLLLLLSACGGGSSSSTNSSTNNEFATGELADAVPDASSCAESISSTRISIPTLVKNFSSACDYFISGIINVDSDLTIEPGTTLIMGKDSSIHIGRGTLIAVGNAENRITIRGEADLTGYWNGITFIQGRPSRIEFVDIVDAGQALGFSGADAALQVSNTAISLIDVSVSNSYVYGVELSGSTQLTAFSNNHFFGNRQAGLLVDSNLIPELDTETDYYGVSEPNGEPVVKLGISFIDIGKTTWPALNAPYSDTLPLRIGQGDELTLDPGAHIATDNISVSNGGKLIARGTPAAPIVFSAAPSSDSWTAMEASLDSSIEFDNVIFKQAEQGINLDGSPSSAGIPNLSISNTTFEDMNGYMIECVETLFGIGSPTITIGENVTYPDSADGLIGPLCP